jgi:transcription elongation factor GreA
LIDENVDHDKVTMGTIVTLQNITDKKKEVYKIVGSMEADILAKPPMISNESPVGKAIL